MKIHLDFNVARIPCLKGFLEYRKEGLLEYRKVDEEIMQEYSEWLFKIFKRHSGIPASLKMMPQLLMAAFVNGLLFQVPIQ